jgi:hypothetical protein
LFSFAEDAAFLLRTCNGAQNKDQLAYVLMCAKCGRVVGEWTSVEEREKELREFAGKVKLFT